jgi:DNA polymerase-3 subunit delta'
MPFSSIKGHAKPISFLKSYIAINRAQGAFLFTGPDGIGKKLVAKAYAAALNCQSYDGDACGVCSSCKKINHGQHPDVHCIEESVDAVKIDQVRSLQQSMALRSFEGGKKVYIIDNAHRLSAEAANALLKSLEEPSDNCVFILITSAPGMLFKTVVSRCQTVKFSPLGRLVLRELLQKDYGLHAHLAHFLAFYCEGRLGAALALKEADILQDKNKVLDEFIFSTKKASDLTLSADRVSLRGYLAVLAAWFRDLYLTKAGGSRQEIINIDRGNDVSLYAQRYTWQELDRIFKLLADSRLYIEQNMNVRLLISNVRAGVWTK